MGQLFFAKFQGQIVAGAFALCLEKNQLTKTALASVSAKLMAHRTFYSGVLFSGRVSEGSQRMTCAERRQATVSTTKHNFLHGVGQFKTSFSKKVTDYVGAFDLVINARKYSVWRSLAERLLLRFYRNILRKNWY